MTPVELLAHVLHTLKKKNWEAKSVFKQHTRWWLCKGTQAIQESQPSLTYVGTPGLSISAPARLHHQLLFQAVACTAQLLFGFHRASQQKENLQNT